MKYIFVISGILFFFSSCSLFPKNDELKALSKKVDSLSTKVAELSEQNKELDEEFTWMENELVRLTAEKPAKSVAAVPVQAARTVVKETVDWRCKAITNSGTRCSRPALEGSKYCWQHKKTYEPDKPGTKPAPAGTVPGSPDKK